MKLSVSAVSVFSGQGFDIVWEYGATKLWAVYAGPALVAVVEATSAAAACDDVQRVAGLAAAGLRADEVTVAQ